MPSLRPQGAGRAAFALFEKKKLHYLHFVHSSVISLSKLAPIIRITETEAAIRFLYDSSSHQERYPFCALVIHHTRALPFFKRKAKADKVRFGFFYIILS